MVHGAQGTLNHLEPPSESEPLSTAVGDVDPVAAQQEGEHNSGSGDEGLGTHDHDDEAAAMEDTADAKDISTHADGAEDSCQPIASSTIGQDPPSLDADVKPETNSSEEIDSTQIPHEEIEDHTKDASPPPFDTSLEPDPPEDTSAAPSDQPATSEEETQLPDEATDNDISKAVVPLPDLNDSPVATEGPLARGSDADSPLPVYVPDTQSPSAASGVEDSSAATQGEPMAEIIEANQDDQVEQEDPLPGSLAASDVVQHEDNDFVDPQAVDPAKPGNMQDAEVLAPTLVETDSSSATPGLLEPQGEEKPVEPQEAPLEASNEAKSEDPQFTADEPTVDPPVADSGDETPAETPAQGLEKFPSGDDVGDTEHSQPSDEVGVNAAETKDEQGMSIQDDISQSAAADAPAPSEEAARDDEANSIHQDAPEHDNTALEPSEASEPKETAIDIAEAPQEGVSDSLRDEQEPVPLEPSEVDAGSSGVCVDTAGRTGEQHEEAILNPPSAAEDAPHEIEPQAGSTEDTAEPTQDLSAPEEQLAQESVRTSDSQPSLPDPEPVESGETLPASDPRDETSTPEAPSSDHDDSGVNVESASDDSVPTSGTNADEKQAAAHFEPAPTESGHDEGLGHDSDTELPEAEGDSGSTRDSGVSMNHSDDNLSDITVKVDTTSGVSDMIETDNQDAPDGYHVSPKVLTADALEGEVSLQKDQKPTEEAPENIEEGELDSAETYGEADYEQEFTSPAEEENKSLPQEEVVSQEPESSDEPLAAETDSSLPQEEVINQELERSEGAPPAEDDSPPQEEVASQELKQVPSGELLLAEEDNKYLGQEEVVSQEQDLAAEQTPAEEADSSVPQDEAPNDEQESSEEPLPAKEDNNTPQEGAVSEEQEPALESLPANDLPASNSDQDGNDFPNEALATGAAAALGAAAVIAAHETSSNHEQDAQVDPERPCTADKSIGPDETSPISEPGDEIAASPKAELVSAAEVESAVPEEPQQPHGDFKPRASRRDSSTQTEELWRPKTPFLRSATPAIVLPDANDSEAKIKSPARLSRTDSRRSIQQAEELVAAAVIIRAAADTLGETSTRMTDAVKELKQHGNADDALHVDDGGRGVGDATRSLRDSSANRLTGVERTSKTDDKSARSPRQHRSSHGSRSSRPSTRESGSKRHSSHRHRHEGDREVEHGSPQTPPRTRDTADSGHRSRKERTERTPQEQADHDRRKEERRLAREKSKTDSPAAESKGKDVEASPSIDRRSSRRHSSRKENVPSIASTGRTESTAPPQASKKFFDKNGMSVVESFGGPLTAETSKDGSLKRSGSKSVRRSLSQNQAKLQKVRVEESVKASKDKVDKERPRESRTTSSATSNGHSSTKDRDDKHRKSRLEKREKEDAANGQKDEKKEKKAGGLKGMFKKLFG